MGSLPPNTPVILQNTKMGMFDGEPGYVASWDAEKGEYSIFVEKLGQYRTYRDNQVRPASTTPSGPSWKKSTKTEFFQWLKENASDRGGDTPEYVAALAYGKEKGWLKKDGGRKTRRRKVSRKTRRNLRRK